MRCAATIRLNQMNSRLLTFGLFNLGGGEIILILFLLFVLAALALGVFGLVYLITRTTRNPPPPVLSTFPPLVIESQRKRDLEHVRLLSVFHFVFAGLALLGMIFLGFHYFMMHTFFTNPDLWKNQNGQPPPPAIMNILIWVYIFGGVFLAAALILNALSGLFLAQRKNRLFSLIIAGLNCLQIPFGTALGIFTIFVLCRDSVRELYAADPNA
jgi:hypothetical protein